MTKQKWVKSTEVIAYKDGYTLDIEGHKYGNFFLRKDNSKGYTITHLPSSILIFPNSFKPYKLANLKVAKQFVKYISGIDLLVLPSTFELAKKWDPEQSRLIAIEMNKCIEYFFANYE